MQVANGTAPADLTTRLGQLKDQAPHLRPAINAVEAAQALTKHDDRWKTVQAEALSLAALDDPAAPLQTIDAFLREYPETPRRADALALARSLKDDLAKRQTAVDQGFVDDLVRSESLPTVSLTDQIERARQFLAEHPQSAVREQVNSRLEMYLNRLDEHDIDQARDFSRQNPTRFASRIERFQNYLKTHQTGGRFVSEAIEAKDRILREWDAYAYRQAYDHSQAHPDDVAQVAQRLRDYLRDHPDGRYAADASRYQDWWDKISVPGTVPRHAAPRRGRAERLASTSPAAHPTWVSSSKWRAQSTGLRPSFATRIGRSGITPSRSRSPGNSVIRSRFESSTTTGRPARFTCCIADREIRWPCACSPVRSPRRRGERRPSSSRRISRCRL